METHICVRVSTHFFYDEANQTKMADEILDDSLLLAITNTGINIGTGVSEQLRPQTSQ